MVRLVNGSLYRSSIDFIGESPIKTSDTDERSRSGLFYL
nr:MAG TPA: hypothetical protein [Caudoviricetes sp.]